MSIDTFDNLKTAIGKWVDRDDLNDTAPDNFAEEFITLAESRHKNDVRIKQMITRVGITVNNRQIAFPARHLETINLRLLTTPLTVLTYVNLHEMNRVRTESTGKPEYFTETSEFEFDVSPDSSYSGEIIYYQSEAALSASNQTNEILARIPDVYLYGALVASAPFLLDDSRIPVWNSLYKAAYEGAAKIDRRKPGPLTSRVSGSTP